MSLKVIYHMPGHAHSVVLNTAGRSLLVFIAILQSRKINLYINAMGFIHPIFSLYTVRPSCEYYGWTQVFKTLAMALLRQL